MRSDTREGIRIFGLSVVGLVATLIVFLLLGVGIWAIAWVWAPWKGAGEARQQTVGSGTYRIAAYDHFYDLCASAQSLQQNLELTKESLKTATGSDKTREQINAQAQASQLNSLIASYNADARKAGTLGQFKSSDLPYALDASQEITCTA